MARISSLVKGLPCNDILGGRVNSLNSEFGFECFPECFCFIQGQRKAVELMSVTSRGLQCLAADV